MAYLSVTSKPSEMNPFLKSKDIFEIVKTMTRLMII
jgi:hypothetical protein